MDFLAISIIFLALVIAFKRFGEKTVVNFRELTNAINKLSQSIDEFEKNRIYWRSVDGSVGISSVVNALKDIDRHLTKRALDEKPSSAHPK